MPESRRHAARRQAPAVLRHGTAHALNVGSRNRKQLVRNVSTGRVLPCCLEDCQREGDNRYQVRVPHDQPRWRDEKTGQQEMLIRIFCGPRHQELWMAYYRKDRGTLVVG